MAQRLEVLARYGHSCGTPFIAAEHAAAHPDYAFDDLHDIIPGKVSAFGAFSEVRVDVVDRQGRPVPAATVNLTSNVDGSSFEVVTDGSGSIDIPYTPASFYTIRAEKGSESGSVELVVSEDGSVSVPIGSDDGAGLMGGFGSGAGIAVFVALAAAAGGGGYVAVQRRMRKPTS
jgi:hypothetical protein